MMSSSTPGSMNDAYELISTERNEEMKQEPMDFSSNHKKTVRFEDESESKIKIQQNDISNINEVRSSNLGNDSSIMLGSQNKKGQFYNYQMADTSAVIQNQIDARMKQINQKYFKDGVQILN